MSERKVGDLLEGIALGKATLQDCSSEVVFFTPGPLVQLTSGRVDPVELFMQASPKEWVVSRLDLDWPVFRGFQDEVWNYRLLAIEKDGWDPLREFFLGIEFWDPKARELWRVLPHRVGVVDELAVRKQSVVAELPKVGVWVLGLWGGQGVWGIREVAGELRLSRGPAGEAIQHEVRLLVDRLEG